MFQINGSACLQELAAIERRVLDAARDGITRVAKIAYRAARETTLFKDRTGELRGTLDILDRGTYGKRLVAPAKYGSYVEKRRPFMANAAAAGSKAMRVIIDDAVDNAVERR